MNNDNGELSLAEKIAIRSLMATEHWPVFVGVLLRERNLWQAYTRNPQVYQSHPDLAFNTARVAELDELLELFESAKPGDGPTG